MRELHNFIHRQQAKAAGGKTAPLVDPSTGEAFAEAPVSSPEEVEQALLSVKDAFRRLGGVLRLPSAAWL